MDGTLIYRVAQAPSTLPEVRLRDLAAAWEAAREAALEARWGSPLRFLFRWERGEADLNLTDRDARCWAAAVESTHGLGTVYGVSTCLRLLALVDLLTRARWTDGFCRVSRDGAELHPTLLRTAARAELTNDGRFDETRFRAVLKVIAAPDAGAAA